MVPTAGHVVVSVTIESVIVVAFILPLTSSLDEGVVVPIPTLPLARTVRPESVVEFDWILAIIPVVAAPVFAT